MKTRSHFCIHPALSARARTALAVLALQSFLIAFITPPPARAALTTVTLTSGTYQTRQGLATTTSSTLVYTWDGSGTATITTSNAASGGAVSMNNLATPPGHVFTATASNGGEIWFAGNISTISGAGGGGAISAGNNATVNVNGVFFLGNTVTLGGLGGAIYAQNNNTINARYATFTGNYANRSGVANGGAIYLGPASTLDATGALFESNTANGTSANSGGGAIFAGAGSLVDITSATLRHNANSGTPLTATTGGGAIFATAAIVLGTNTLFDSNTAAANGGAIYINAGTLAFNSATFTGNTASGNLGGGAIFMTTAAITGTFIDTLFTNNTAKVNGGALDIEAPATLNFITTRDATYTGNTALNNTTAPVATAGGFLYLNNPAATLTFDIAPAATLTIGSATAAASGNTAADTLIGVANSTITINPAAASAAAPAGALVLNANNTANRATITLSAGTLLLGNKNAALGGPVKILSGATFGGSGTVYNNTTNGTLTLAPNTTLAIGNSQLGTLNSAPGTLNIAGPLTLAPNMTLDYGIYAAAGVPASDLLAITGALNPATYFTTGTLNITTFATGTYTLINATGGLGLGALTATDIHDTLAFTIAGAAFNTALGTYDFYTNNNSLYLILLAAAASNNHVLTWTGAAGGATTTAWFTDPNWTTTAGATTTATTFTHGDIINLADTTPAPALGASNTLTLATTATLAALYLTGTQSHTLAGAGITAAPLATTGPLAATAAATGKLILGATAAPDGTLTLWNVQPENAPAPGATAFSPAAAYTGTLDLTAITGTNHFQNGVDLYTGALAISTAAQLGATLNDLHFLSPAPASGASQAATLLINGTVTFDGANSPAATQLLTLAPDTAGAIYIAATATLTLANNANATAPGGAIHISPNATLTLAPQSLLSSSEISNLQSQILILSNTAPHGGAIYNAGTLTLAAATLANNTATLDGGALYIAAAAATFTGANLAFTDNTAAQNGGAIYSAAPTATLTLGGNTLFARNTATAAGGAIFATNLTLNTTTGDIAFTNNTANGAPNSIALAGGALTIDGSHNVYFDDPIAPAPAATGNTLIQNTTGLVQFAGSSTLAPAADATGGAVTINAGQFRVIQNATFTTGPASAQPLTLAATATLAGAGAITSPGGFTLAGAISPDNNNYAPAPALTSGLQNFRPSELSSPTGTLTLDGNATLTAATLIYDIASLTDHDLIAITGAATFATTTSTIAINPAAALATGTYTLLTAATITYNTAPLALAGIATTGRQTATLAQNPATLDLILAIENKTLTWTNLAADNLWTTTATNWLYTDPAPAPPTPDAFIPGDHATFTDAGDATTSTITITPAGVQVAGMTITGGARTFTGGPITSTPITTLTAATATTQRLDITNATLTNSTTLAFAAGLTLASATLANTAAITGGATAIEATDTAILITNSPAALIQGADNGITLDAGGLITNDGIITATAPAGLGILANAPALITNNPAGLITGAALYGGTLANSGTILGVAAGILGNGQPILVTNTTGALIRGGNGITLNNGGIISNAGAITGTNLNGIYSNAPAPAIITNTPAALIQGANAGIMLLDGAITNAGLIQGGAAGISLVSGTIANSGTITSTNNIGIYTDGPTLITNNTSALIQGGPNGIYLNAGGTITNAGLIQAASAAIAANAPVTLLNTGTITGNVTLAASYFAANNTITLAAASLITGNLTIADPASTLTLADSQSEIRTPQSAISAAVGGALTFTGTLIKTGTTTWLLDRTDPAFAPQAALIQSGELAIAPAATLTLAGPLILADTATLSLAAGPTPAITAATATIAPAARLDITGYTPVTTTPAYPIQPDPATTLIHTTAGVTGFNPANVTIAGAPAPTVDFLKVTAHATATDIIIDTLLTWNLTDGNATGAFTLNAAQTFTLNAPLADNPAAAPAHWDGKTLTKLGPGTLILAAANTYTGTTLISAGTLENTGTLAGAQLTISPGATLENTGAITAPIANSSTLANAGHIAAPITNTAHVTNTGLITAPITNTALVTNTGLITAPATAILLNAGAIANTGTIKGDTAITAPAAPALITNTPAALIQGAATAITLAAGGTIDNSGLITAPAAIHADGNTTLINTGTITGNVTLTAPANTVTLAPASLITGNLTIAAPASTLTLADSQSEIRTPQSAISAAVGGALAFTGTLIKTATTTWLLDAYATTAAYAAFLPAATLIQTGTLAVNWQATQLNNTPIDISANATLQLNSTAPLTLAAPLTGNGLVAIDTAGSAISFTTHPSPLTTPFTGTISLLTTTFTLDAPAAATLAAATLQLNPGNTTTLAPAAPGTTQATLSIGNLTLNGGKLILTATAPDISDSGLQNFRPSELFTATLALATGTIQLTIPATIPNPMPPSANTNLFAQTTGTLITHLITSTTITGNPANITLIDQNNNPAPTTPATKQILITEGPANTTVATGTYTYKLTATPTGTAAGLDLAYALASLTILDNQTLTLAATPGMTPAQSTFTATISGGPTATLTLAAAEANSTITLAAAGGNNYTGAATLTTGTLIAAANNALGAPTATLTLAPNTALNLAGKTQTLSTLTANNSALIALAGGTLSITNTLTLGNSTTTTLGNNGRLTAATIALADNARLTAANTASTNGARLTATLITTGTAATITLNAGALFTTATLTLAPAATLTLNTGTLITTAPNALATAPGSTLHITAGQLDTAGGILNGTLNANTGGRLNITAGNLIVNAPDTTFAATVNIAATSTLTLNTTTANILGNPANAKPITLAAPDSTLSINNTGTTLATLNNPLSGPGQLTFNGPGTTTLATDNTPYTGNTTIAANSTVLLTNPAALGATGTATIAGNLTVGASQATPSTFSLNTAGTGTLTLTGANSDPIQNSLTLTGANTIQNIAITNNAQVTAAAPNTLGTPTTRITITNATLLLDANNMRLGPVTLNAPARLAFTPPTGATTPFKTATLASLTSTAASTETGGAPTLAFNTDIAAAKSDTLVITGALTGTYHLALANTGAVPTAGATTLTLITTTNTAATEAATFISQDKIDIGMNTYDITLHPAAPKGQASTIAITIGADLAADRSDLGNLVIATAGSMPLTWFTELDTLTQRLGALRIFTATTHNDRLNLWMRTHAQRLNVDSAATGATFNETQYATEAGADYGTMTPNNNALYAGAFAGYGATTRTLTDTAAAGGASGYTNAITAGLYFTLLTPDGWYADTVLKYNHFTNHLNVPTTTARYTNSALGVSIEAGRHIQLRNDWYIEPLAQLATAQLSSANYTTTGPAPLRITAASGNTTQLRAGAQAGWRHTLSNGAHIQPHARLTATQQWTSGSTLTVAADPHGPYATQLQAARLEAALGLAWTTPRGTQLYFDYEYARAKDYTKPWSLSAGIRHQW